MGWQVMKRAGLKLKKAENKVQEVVIGICSGVYKNAHNAAEALQIPQKQATIHRRLTSTERVLAGWVKFYGFAGLPLSRKTIAAKVHKLCGKIPGLHWLDCFLRRHPDCSTGHPLGLDPKRAQAFNPMNVKAHFNWLEKEFANDGRPIPARNIYNMDKVGIQS
ncbi:hypothetical protein FB451DRAFT_1404380 [Mycena latifolia]|nr:hypothetical protein FB451DRAFT_1404380 [Mycena latifolia]